MKKKILFIIIFVVVIFFYNSLSLANEESENIIEHDVITGETKEIEISTNDLNFIHPGAYKPENLNSAINMLDIYGEDNRYRINEYNTSRYPYSAICRI